MYDEVEIYGMYLMYAMLLGLHEDKAHLLSDITRKRLEQAVCRLGLTLASTVYGDEE